MRAMSQHSSQDVEWLVERLISALAAQVAQADPPVLAPRAAQLFTELRRGEAGMFFGVAGHLCYYGAGDGDRDEIQRLTDLVARIQRDEAFEEGAVHGLLPGDVVRDDDAEDEYDRQLNWTVRFVGDDGTADLQPADDYILHTRPITVLSRHGGP